MTTVYYFSTGLKQMEAGGRRPEVRVARRGGAAAARGEAAEPLLGAAAAPPAAGRAPRRSAPRVVLGGAKLFPRIHPPFCMRFAIWVFPFVSTNHAKQLLFAGHHGLHRICQLC